jgi:hypothetical protein
MEPFLYLIFRLIHLFFGLAVDGWALIIYEDVRETRLLRIGFVPEHFFTPLHFVKQHFRLNAALVAFSSSTGTW